MSVFVGLDCGGSSCRVLALDSSGVILFQGQSGAANLASTPENRLRKNLLSASRGCPPADFVCGCFAGLISENLRERGLTVLADTFGRQPKLRAEPDYSAALYASDEADVCVVSGTGSLICSRNQGQIVKSGGRGYVYGDEGSGFVIGRDFVQHFLRSKSALSSNAQAGLIDVFGSIDEREVISATYRAQSPATILAKLVKTVAQEANAGEDYAVEIVENAMTSLASLVTGHFAQYRSQQKSFSVSLAGGVWKANLIFRETFDRVLQQQNPKLTLSTHKISKPPVYGAVELARQII